MQCKYNIIPLTRRGDWQALQADMDPSGRSKSIGSVLASFEACGAVIVVEESVYIDRDFSAAYAKFYSTLYHPPSKFCRRFHFLKDELTAAWAANDPGERAALLNEADRRKAYLGYLVVRPLADAPLGSALISSSHLRVPGAEVSVRSVHTVHLFGAELHVEGVPVTEQDHRTGACAQATIWSAARHFHNRYGTPWVAISDITEAALKPTDADVSRALPAGSSFLMADSMVRAIRSLGEHPIVYGPDRKDDGAAWEEQPHRTILRYVDSGIPVILAVQRGDELSHTMLVIGSVASGQAQLGPGATTTDQATHLLVNDDQRGAYQLLPVSASLRKAQDDYSLEDADIFIVPVPNKVFLKAETAEKLARERLIAQWNDREELGEGGAEEVATQLASIDPNFYGAIHNLVARTYLTYGWRYKQRLYGNNVPIELKQEVDAIHLPRFVYVTEFSLPEDVTDLDPCRRRVRAQVVVDATGGKSEQSVLIVHMPGLVLVRSFDPSRSGQVADTIAYVLPGGEPFRPKVRGQSDYSFCEPTGAVSAAAEGASEKATKP